MVPRAAAVRPPVAAWAPYSDAEPAAAAAAPQEGPPPPALKPLRQYVHVEGADGATLFGQVCDGRRGLVGVVLLSPHPTFGGSRATLEPAYAALAAAGCSVLAYDVRGSGKSTGRRTWSRRAERQDAIACARFVEARGICKGVVLAGASFGATVALAASPGSSLIVGAAAIGFPWRAAALCAGTPPRSSAAKPRLFVSGHGDCFGPPRAAARLEQESPALTKAVTVPASGHRALCGAEAAASHLVRWVTSTFNGAVGAPPQSLPLRKCSQRVRFKVAAEAVLAAKRLEASVAHRKEERRERARGHWASAREHVAWLGTQLRRSTAAEARYAAPEASLATSEPESRASSRQSSRHSSRHTTPRENTRTPRLGHHRSRSAQNLGALTRVADPVSTKARRALRSSDGGALPRSRSVEAFDGAQRRPATGDAE